MEIHAPDLSQYGGIFFIKKAPSTKCEGETWTVVICLERDGVQRQPRDFGIPKENRIFLGFFKAPLGHRTVSSVPNNQGPGLVQLRMITPDASIIGVNLGLIRNKPVQQLGFVTAELQRRLMAVEIG